MKPSGEPLGAKPVVKWVGGKTSLLSDLLKACPESFHAYHEPFVGGGALFWALIDHSDLRYREAYLSDLNPMLVETYTAIRDNPEGLIKELRVLEKLYYQQDPEDLYYRVRDAWNQCFRSPARFMFLKATAFNGLWRENKKGQHNVAWGKYKNPKLCDEAGIFRAAKALTRARITHQTWEESCTEPIRGDLVYFDPPYLGTFDMYNAEEFGREKHAELLKQCREFDEHGIHVLYSNEASPEMKELVEEYWPEAEQILVYARRYVNRDGDGRQPVPEYLLRSRP